MYLSAPDNELANYTEQKKGQYFLRYAFITKKPLKNSTPTLVRTHLISKGGTDPRVNVYNCKSSESLILQDARKLPQ